MNSLMSGYNIVAVILCALAVFTAIMVFEDYVVGFMERVVELWERFKRLVLALLDGSWFGDRNDPPPPPAVPARPTLVVCPDEL